MPQLRLTEAFDVVCSWIQTIRDIRSRFSPLVSTISSLHHHYPGTGDCELPWQPDDWDPFRNNYNSDGIHWKIRYSCMLSKKLTIDGRYAKIVAENLCEQLLIWGRWGTAPSPILPVSSSIYSSQEQHICAVSCRRRLKSQWETSTFDNPWSQHYLWDRAKNIGRIIYLGGLTKREKFQICNPSGVVWATGWNIHYLGLFYLFLFWIFLPTFFPTRSGRTARQTARLVF